MGRRTILGKYQVLTAADTTTNPESVQTDISGIDFITYEFTQDATVNCLIEVQYCNDDRIDSLSVFKSLDFGTTIPAIGSTDTEGIIHIENLGFKWMKIVITNNAGTGNINSWISGTARGA